jgi:DNA-binding transcriptional LysR family regulator
MVARGRLEIGLRTTVLRREPFHCVLPAGHPLAKKRTVPWRALTGEPLVILARREGVGLHDAILTACQRARFASRLVHTPSVIHTVLSYVEAGAGIGIIPDSVAVLGGGAPLAIRPLVPTQSIELVMVWAGACTSPASSAFRAPVAEWVKTRKLWSK